MWKLTLTPQIFKNVIFVLKRREYVRLGRLKLGLCQNQITYIYNVAYSFVKKQQQ
jgi:hypothetical protein